ncbi:MAG: prepilin-type N-terminal cleavage/methylation domain-containing protein [Sideroxyarcus sp.]|nr:prepilin-type N-terminal cleavage/methylation domain-containing protein [Sideroxyarcus sp.]
MSGFSLVEMAVVLAIVALLMGGLLPMLSGQQERAQRNETRQQMEEIRQALIGFAVVNGRLPCPTDPTITDPTHADYGSERADCSAAPTEEGYLPWKTLGVSEIDAWGTKRSAIAQPWNGYWRYRVNRNFANTAALITMTTSPSAADALVVQERNGTQITSNTENPVAIVFSAGPDLTPNGENGDAFEAASGTYVGDTPGSLPDGTQYDDMLVWISRPQIINRLVATGKLP